MLKTCLLTFAFNLVAAFSFGQKTYELDELKQPPVVDEANMEIISKTVWAIYKEAIIAPETSSTIDAVNEVVYGFYDYYSDGVLKKVNPMKGEQYTSLSKVDLGKNNRLRYNLTFDEYGKLVVPEKMFIVSYRNEEVNENSQRKIITKGQLSFEYSLPDSVKNRLAAVRLQRVAKADKNSLTHELSAVRTLIPFDLEKQEGTRGYKGANEVYYGEVVKKNSDIVLRDPSSRFQYEDTDVVALLKEQTNLMDYKKGVFSFEIRTKYSGMNIDLNIFRDTFIGSEARQRKYFGEGRAYVSNFKEEEKKK